MGINIKLNNCYVYSSAVVCTKEEASSIKEYVDIIHENLFAGEKTYVDGEKKMAKEAISLSLKKANLNVEDIDFTLGGDLSNQMATSNDVASFVNTPFLGVYGACSTSILSLGIAGIILEAKFAKNILAFTSSNYGSSERQFRYPTSYGLQKKETSTITVSAASSVIVSSTPSKVKVSKVTFGKVIDSLEVDANDMGSIMAIAAYDTILKHIKDNNVHLNDYDLVLTGDLSKFGLNVLKDMLLLHEEDVSKVDDAGAFIYQGVKDKYQGGSGPSCLPSVAFSVIINKMIHGEYKKVLLVATGALHSKESVANKNSINVIAHALELEVNTL